MKKISIGICIPPPVPANTTASVHKAGIGRIPKKTYLNLMRLIKGLKDVEIYNELNFRKTYIKNGKIYQDNFCLNDLDIFFWYCELDRSVGSYDLEVLKTLALDTKVVINPYRFELGLDKYSAHLLLRKAGVSVSDTVLFDHNNIDYIKSVIEDWGQAVLKPRRGGFGKGVLLIENFPMLRDMVEYIHSTTGVSPDKAFMIERFYDNDINDWVSTTLINGQLMYGYRKRKSKLVSFGNNFFKVYDANEVGGEVDKCEVTQEQYKEAIKAFDALGSEIAGFDIITHKGIPIIVDENTFPGYYEHIFHESGKDPAEEFFNLMVSEIDKLRI